MCTRKNLAPKPKPEKHAHKTQTPPIPDDSLPLWVIDGQHGVEGLKTAIDEDKSFRDYPVVMAMFAFNDTYDEMMPFHIVNLGEKVFLQI